MKLTKLCAIATALALVSIPLFAAEEKSPLKFSINVQAAYYPDNAHLTTLEDGVEADHYSPIIGAYSGLEGRITPKVEYTLKTPLGDNWLVSGANVNFSAWMGITPVSICPGASVSFTPLPFLVFSAGGETGTGWNVGDLFKGGMGLWANDTPLTPTDNNRYVTSPFTNWYYKTWFQGTFQFDTGAIIKGDWTHVLMLFTYQAYYKGYSGAQNGELWTWNCSGNQANGWYEYMNAILAYQLPTPVLKRVGLMFESEGAYSASVYERETYMGNFKEISLEPLFQFDFDKHNSLVVLFHFKSRRAYDTVAVYEDADRNLGTPEAAMFGSTVVGREWFFNRVALSYTYTF